MKGVYLSLPPKAEQAEILSYIEKELLKIRSAISRGNREIELLGEYRTRLIADVVTGKTDVRDAAAAFPEVEPLEAEDDLDDSVDTDAEAGLNEIDAIAEEAGA